MHIIELIVHRIINFTGSYLKFDFSHSQGDIIGLNFEVNGVNSSKTQRIFHFNLGDKRDGDCSFTKRMSDLVFVELVQ